MSISDWLFWGDGVRELLFAALLLTIAAPALMAQPFPASGAQPVVATQLNESNYTVAYANRTVQSAVAYVNKINQSGYLIFYPNLTAAGSYLSKAEALYNKTPSLAVFYAGQAVTSAQAQYQNIGRYRLWSFGAMAALTVIAAIALSRSLQQARPAKQEKAKQAKKSKQVKPARKRQR